MDEQKEQFENETPGNNENAPDKKDEGQAEGDEKKSEGPKKQTRESHDEAFWFSLCERYKRFQEDNPKKNCSQRAFLKSPEAEEVTGAPRECRSFSRYWKRYVQGELNPSSNRRRRRSVGYFEIEERLSTYLRLRADIFVRGDVHGATWAKLKQKCVRWGARELKELQAREENAAEAEDPLQEPAEASDVPAVAAAANVPATAAEGVVGVTEGAEQASGKESASEKANKKYSDFRASPGWLHKVLKRNNIESKYLQSEMDAKEEHNAMEDWIPKFHQTMVDMNISGSCLYNAATTSLFYRMLPSTKLQRKHRRQHVPTEERITLMVCTAADGTKVPLAAVGKPRSAHPVEDDDDDDAKESKPKPDPPVAYTSHPNAWFDPTTTVWWIHEVFWPFHVQQHGAEVPCVLLLDHCPAHMNLEVAGDKILPANLKIVYYPVNMSRKRHPAEGGTIASIKLGYKLKMASSVLALFDLFGGFQGAQERFYGRGPVDEEKIGTGGLACGDPATLLDALMLLKQVWSARNKFCTTTLILEGWKKTKLLPSWWEEEIDVWIRNGAAAPRSGRKGGGWNEQDCLQLCHVLQSLVAKIDEAGLERSQIESSAMRGSYVLMQRDSDTFRAERDEDIWNMATEWIELEEDPNVREHTLEYECDQVLAAKKLELEKKRRLDEGKEGLHSTTRYERIQVGLEEAKEYAQDLGLDESVVKLLDRFETKLGLAVKRLQKTNDGRMRRKRVKLNVDNPEAVMPEDKDDTPAIDI